MSAADTPTRPVTLVIFDCDGVLVDSEPIAAAVLVETLRTAGVTLTEDVIYERFLGRSMATVAQILDAEYGLAVTDDFLGAMRARLYARFRTDLRAIPGVDAALGRLTCPFCVASSSQVERIRLTLDLTGLAPRFGSRIFSATMVSRGKPAPDLFLHAARVMGESPETCVVIEDSPAGIEAAKRAGMRVLAYVGGSHAAASGLRSLAESLEPDAIFDDFGRLDTLLLGLEGRGAADSAS